MEFDFEQLQNLLRQAPQQCGLFSELLFDYAYSASIDENGKPTTEWMIGAFEEISGYTIDELKVPNAISELIHPDDVEVLSRNMERLHRGESFSSESRLITKSGEVKWIRDRMRPVVDPDTGRLCGVIGAVEEITKLVEARQRNRELEAQVLRIQKLNSLGVLAGGIAHDMNNVLVGMLGHSEICLKKAKEDSPLRSSLAQIRSAAMSLADLADQMLAYAGGGARTAEPVDLSRLCRDVMGLIEVSIPKGVEFSLLLQDPLPPVLADGGQLQQVVLNIVKNAADAVDPLHGKVRLKTGVIFAGAELLERTFVNDGLREGEYIYLEVTDDGVGMDESTLQQIFDPFFTTKEDGHGLGMAAVLGIVRNHRGAIRVDSKPGDGTTVVLYLPPVTVQGN